MLTTGKHKFCLFFCFSSHEKKSLLSLNSLRTTFLLSFCGWYGMSPYTQSTQSFLMDDEVMLSEVCGTPPHFCPMLILPSSLFHHTGPSLSSSHALKLHERAPRDRQTSAFTPHIKIANCTVSVLSVLLSTANEKARYLPL